jgi:hypothetical protein
MTIMVMDPLWDARPLRSCFLKSYREMYSTMKSIFNRVDIGYPRSVPYSGTEDQLSRPMPAKWWQLQTMPTQPVADCLKANATAKGEIQD